MTTRRAFLKTSAAAGLAANASLFSALGRFGGAQAADTSGYKALVCIFLIGGMDHADTILPYDDSSYDRYATIRAPLLARYANNPGGSTRVKSQLLPLSPVNQASFGSRQFALPPELGGLKTLFDDGKAAIVGNVGPLLQPVDRFDLEDDDSLFPPRLYSHNDQQSVWQALEPEGARVGWGGLFADAMIASGANQNPAFTAVTPAGNNVFLSGLSAQSYQIGGLDGTTELFYRSENAPLTQESKDLMGEFFAGAGQSFTNLFQQDIQTIQANALATNSAFGAALGAVTQPLTTSFPQSFLGVQMEAVASVMNARAELQANRQVFYVLQPGYDTHSEQAQAIPALHADLAECITALYAATQEMGISADVTSFTASDFGRTLAINGDGTDHGWGGHHFVIGDSVIGNRIYGELPIYDFDHPLDDGGGRLVPSVSIQQYAGTLGRWFGLTQSELNQALPGRQSFPQMDLGFV